MNIFLNEQIKSGQIAGDLKLYHDWDKDQGHIIFLTKYKTTYSFGYNLRVYYSVN